MVVAEGQRCEVVWKKNVKFETIILVVLLLALISVLDTFKTMYR